MEENNSKGKFSVMSEKFRNEWKKCYINEGYTYGNWGQID